MRAAKNTKRAKGRVGVKAAEGKANFVGMDNPLSPLFPVGPEALVDWLFSGFFEGPGECEPVTVWLLPGGRVQ